MQRKRNWWLTAGVLIGALGLVACGPSGPSEQELALQAEWSWLQETKQALDAKRQELAELKERAAAAVEEGAEEAAEAVPTEAEIEALATGVGTLAEEYQGRLVKFLNDDPMIEGEPPSERQRQALRYKSGEDLVLAQEWIDKGGDYKRAIEIYQGALNFDPDNEELKEALALAEEMRFMSKERFAQAKNGMTEAEVRAALGQPNLHNVREFEAGVIGWFYPTSPDGHAAAVWFRPRGGALKVYKVNYEELKPQAAS